VPRRSLALALALVVAASCGPRLEANGSNPGTVPALAYLYANDPAISYNLTNGAMLLAYDDEAGAFTADTTHDVLVPKASPSRAGISASSDHGKTWTRVGPIAPAGAGCGDPQCAVQIAGSASLEPSETSDQSFWVGLAYTGASLTVPDAIAYSSSSDRTQWSPARIGGWMANRPPGEPSIARAGGASVIAFTDLTQGELFFLPFDGAAPPPGAPYLVPIVRDDAGVPKAHPIVRLYSGLLGYVAYLLPHDEQGTTFDLRVAKITRSYTQLGLTPWQALVAFRLDDIAIDPTRPGALGRNWRDATPIGLALGKGPQIHLVYRALSSETGRSKVFVVECDATSVDDCAIEGDGTNSLSWTITALDDLLPSTSPGGGEYRPTVAADKLSGAVAFTWMKETAPGSAQVQVLGASSTNPEGLELTAATSLTGGAPWTPCPTAGLVGADTHSFGTHDSTTVLPFMSDDTDATVVTGYVDSSLGCQELGQLTFDQHVEVATW